MFKLACVRKEMFYDSDMVQILISEKRQQQRNCVNKTTQALPRVYCWQQQKHKRSFSLPILFVVCVDSVHHPKRRQRRRREHLELLQVTQELSVDELIRRICVHNNRFASHFIMKPFQYIQRQQKSRGTNLEAADDDGEAFMLNARCFLKF